MPRERKVVAEQQNEILILVGVPGSGKSTFANELVKKHDRYIKISRDDIRKMVKDSYMVSEDNESIVSAIQDANIKAALSKGKSIVLDNTHCKVKYIKDIINKYGKDNIISIKFVGSELSMKEIKANNLARDKAVPEAVIDQMYKGFKNVMAEKRDLLDYIDLMKLPKTTAVVGEQDPSLTKAIIVDIDGTVAHMNNKRGPFDWLKVDMDDPDFQVLNIVRTLSSTYKVIFLSGREETAREKTEMWLDVYYGKEYEGLLMRGKGDYRKDSIVKRELYDTYVKDKYFIEAVFDDRDQVVNMWREDLGLKCLQVEYGDF